MKVRGIAVLTRKELVTRAFGADAWALFYDDIARSHRCFRSFVTPDSLVPLPAFLAFHDELMRRFFRDDEASYFALGRRVSRWALNEGPLKAFREQRDLAGVVGSLPAFHQIYFADAQTRSEARLVEDGVEFKVSDLPEWHPYFEHLIVGYITEVLEMACANPIRAARVRGGKEREYVYLLSGSPRDDSREADEVPPRTRGGDRLSDREMDVLLLIARGKTNEQIGAALGISPKTAQHHVARAYRRIGVSGRVNAALWLAQRGLIGR